MFHAIFAWLWSMIRSGFVSTLSWLRSSFLNVWSQCEQFIYELFGKLIGYLPSEIQTYFSREWWAPMASGLNLVTYFIPIRTILAVAVGGFTIVAYIRIVRWVKSFIPTIGD